MLEFLGVIVLALAFALLGLVTPWCRRRQDTWYMRLFLGDALTIGFLVLLASGVALVTTQLSQQQAAGHTGELVISIVALVVGVPAVTYGMRRLFGLARAAN